MKWTAKQREAIKLLATPATHILLEGGSRSGKTFLFCERIVYRALKAAGSRHLITRFRFNHCKQSIGLETLPAVMRMRYPQVPMKLNKEDWYGTLPNGSEIWLGGLDDKDRTEKILGKEYATIFMNEASQIPWASRNIAITRLAQKCEQTVNGKTGALPLRAYYDCNPPSKGHWLYKVFHRLEDPESKRALRAFDFVHMRLNPEDNQDNLPDGYLAQLRQMSERMQRRFLRGEYGEEAPGQLWTEEMIDKWRVLDGELPDMLRVGVAIDPSGADDADNAENDEIGIMVGGLGTDGRGYLLEDLTLKAGPSKWGKVAVDAYDRRDGDFIAAEINFGGAMVKHVVQTAAARPDRTSKLQPPFRLLTASRGKVVRAEPIAGLHEQGKIRLVGNFPKLEDELCAMTTHGYVGDGSPNRADAFVWLFSELFPGMVKAEQDKPAPRVQRYYGSGAGAWMT